MLGVGKPVPSVADLIITPELEIRPPKKTDYRQEKLAVQELASRMIDRPEEILSRFVELALEITGAAAGGLSLYEEQPAPGVFRWKYLHGRLAPFEGATTPRHFSPCGVTLDQNAPLLMRNPERHYDWVAQVKVEIPEVLLVPLYFKGGDVAVGTLWMVADRNGYFDRGDVRAMTELASFVGTALRIQRTEERLQSALAQQELLAAELQHRVKNLFALTESLIHRSRRGASTADELAEALTGRLRALGSAHGLVRRGFADTRQTSSSSDLAELVRTIVTPHDRAIGDGATRFSSGGPPVECSDHASTGLALVLHELATNAVKYGALSSDRGQVDIGWQLSDGTLRLRWDERGGPVIEDAPASMGFGSKLVRSTITGQLGGTLRYDWRPEGLAVAMEIPASGLAG